MEELAIGVLKFCASLNVFGCIVAAVAITMWTAGSQTVTGVILAAGGVSGWAFLLVVCSIAESLIVIRTNTALPASSRLFDRDAK